MFYLKRISIILAVIVLTIGVFNAYGQENDSSDKVKDAAHQKICDKMISIIENNFSVESRGAVSVKFGDQYDLWFVASKGFDEGSFTLESIVNAVEKEFGNKIKQSFQVVQDFWISMNSGLWKDVLNETESKVTSNELMMIRSNKVPGKINRQSEMKNLVCLTVLFTPGEFND